MKVVIAEKRDVARKLAKVLGATTDKKDWFEGAGWCISWCQGHLLELRVPEAEGRWRLDNLPIIPERFDLGPISNGRDKEGHPIEDAGTKHRLKVIRDLFRQCDGIVCATDAAREGQLIFDRVYQYIGIRKPTQRLWISSLTDKAIKNGFNDLKPNSDYDNLAHAARLRGEADWIVGINATRAFTLSSGAQRVLSLGRVQTPTLCMVCQRYEENRDFKSEPYWCLVGESTKDGIAFKWRCDTHYTDKAECETDRDSVINGGYLLVTSVNTERKNEDPPLLHDIASLQKAANSKYGLTAKQTLDAAQSLYEKQLISYPRTGSRYISEDILKEVPALLCSLSWNAIYGPGAKALADSGSLNRRSVDATKVTDHHGLIITGNEPGTLNTVESQVYELVMTRFIEAFSPACVADVTGVEMTSGDVVFKANGRKELFPGWRSVLKELPAEDVAMDDVDQMQMSTYPLPQLTEGEKVAVGKLDMLEEMTKPKPLLTDATLLSAMENAGRRCDDKAMAKALKGVGIGTPATRDSIIEELIRKTYIVREKKKLRPTELGLEVYHKIKEKEIANVEMTAKWEISLEDVAEGTSDGSRFDEAIKKYATKITSELINMENKESIAASAEMPSAPCPKCGRRAQIGGAGLSCECGLKIWRTVGGKRLTDAQIAQLATERQTGLIRGMKKKDGTTFEAALKFDQDWKVVFFWPEREKGEAIKCPKCGGEMRINEKGAWCPSCRTSLWRECYGKRLTDAQIKELAEHGKTGVLSGFRSKAGKTYSAALVLDENYRATLEFDNNKEQGQ